MKASAFSYTRASSVTDALDLLALHGDQAKVLSGGQSLMPALNMRLSAPALLVDIGAISELRGISELKWRPENRSAHPSRRYPEVSGHRKARAASNGSHCARCPSGDSQQRHDRRQSRACRPRIGASGLYHWARRNHCRPGQEWRTENSGRRFFYRHLRDGAVAGRIAGRGRDTCRKIKFGSFLS